MVTFNLYNHFVINLIPFSDTVAFKPFKVLLFHESGILSFDDRRG